MNAWFADTGYWIAFLNTDDALHDRAVALNERISGFLITTQWVLTELLDGCGSRPTRGRAAELIRILRGQEDVTIVPASEESFSRGIELYEARLDKDWSLTDCISFLVMHEYGLTDALTADHHFEQAGFVALLRQDQT